MTYARVERLKALTGPERTIGAVYGPAMDIEDPNEAREYLGALVEWQESRGTHPEKAVYIEKVNLGYYAGYYGRETMSRVNQMFDTAHPVFGREVPETEKSLNLGYELGEFLKQKEN